jgi:succinate dehydrogenase/fumarate reductase-like Fe-S protein
MISVSERGVLKFIFGIRSLTVFREQTFKEHRVMPSEWISKQELDDDIVCAACMKNTPLLLATGCFDGEIVIWNSVSELVHKRLVARKRPKKEDTKSLSLSSSSSSSTSSSSVKNDKQINKSLKVLGRKVSKQESEQLDSLPVLDSDVCDHSFSISTLNLI